MSRPEQAPAWPKGALLSLCAGLLHAQAMANPWDGQPLWWLQLLALGLLAWQLERSTQARNAAVLGWTFATGWLVGTFWWLYISMHTYGGLAAPLAASAVVLLAAALAAYYAIACALYVHLAPTGKMARALLFAMVWLLAELMRGRWFSGFGWGGSGYAHVQGPLAGYAPWLGVYGVGAVSAWLAMALPQAWRAGAGHRAALVLVLSAPMLWTLGTAPWTVSNGKLGLALLQGNIPQDEKFQPGSGVPLALAWYGEQLLANQASLIVAPETAIPLLPRQLPPGYWARLQARYTQGAQAALVGMPQGSISDGYTNAVLGLKPGMTQAWQYDKYHLVPFGEYIPPLFRWFTDLMRIPLGDFNRGELRQPPFEWAGQRLSLNICYEDLFGEELGARFLEREKAPTVFVNVSNIAWFGNTVAIDQHLQISRMRALEFARPFVRSTNTGATAIVDHEGRVVAELPRHTRGVLVGEVQGQEGITPYAWWVSRWGLWPLWAIGAAAVFGAVRRRRKTGA